MQIDVQTKATPTYYAVKQTLWDILHVARERHNDGIKCKKLNFFVLELLSVHMCIFFVVCL